MPRRGTSLIIGLTGGIAAGKSTVSDILKARGLPVICADALSHALTQVGGRAYRPIRRLFGPTILAPDQSLRRDRIAALVFGDAEKRRALEAIIHPRVRRETLRQIRELSRRHPVIVLDVPLLFESGFDALCDATLCVAAHQGVQIERLRKSRKMTRAEALARIRSQMPLKDKIKRADHVVWNNGSRPQLRQAVETALQEILPQVPGLPRVTN